MRLPPRPARRPFFSRKPEALQLQARCGRPSRPPQPGQPSGRTHGQPGPWGRGRGRGREEEGPGPHSAPHAPPWAGTALGGPCSPPSWLSVACSVGLASPAWTFLWTGRRSSRVQACAPQSRPQKPRGRTEALRKEGAHWPDRQKSQGPHGLGGHRPLHILPEGGHAQDPAQFPPFCRPRRPPKTDGGSTPAFLRCSSRDIGPPFRSVHFTGLQFAQCHATVTSTQFQNLPPAPQRVPVCITVVVASSSPPTLPAWGPHSASRDLPVRGVHTRAACRHGLRDSPSTTLCFQGPFPRSCWCQAQPPL